MLDNPTWSAIYAPRGYLLVEGDYVRRLEYSRTLERVAEEGADAFYLGNIAQSMVDTVQSFGGILSLEDVSDSTLSLTDISLRTIKRKVTLRSTKHTIIGQYTPLLHQPAEESCSACSI